MKIGCIQFENRDSESKEETIERMQNIVCSLSSYDLIVLPEVWATGYFAFDRYLEEAEDIHGPLSRYFSHWARTLNAYVFGGSFIEKHGNDYYNTSLLLDRNGDIMQVYRKIHLFRYGSREGELLTPGKRASVAETEDGTVGLSTCFDLRFPELYRAQHAKGAELFFVTSAWPHQRLEHWQWLNRVRALENQAFLIACNGCGHARGVRLGGHSMVTDPWGECIASLHEEAAVLTAELDLARVRTVRSEFPMERLPFD